MVACMSLSAKPSSCCLYMGPELPPSSFQLGKGVNDLVLPPIHIIFHK
jgi:hypothetical protein